MKEYKTIEVFQDLQISTSEAEPPHVFREAFREAVLKSVASPWAHDAAAEARVNDPIRKEEIIAFQRADAGGLPAALLMLWVDQAGYRVSNIVPKELGTIGISTYNALLQNFVETVLENTDEVSFTIVQSKARQSPEDWLGAAAAERLQLFSAAANKASIAGHWSDQERWDDFVIAAHKSHSRLEASLLRRWFEEAEGWPHEAALDFSSRFEDARELLRRYDLQRAR